ncbi:outer membrane beta-barrel protein [Poritiphilus flavus]|uniref:Outer membrane beta-barrel protein n=1 Tax=Poritiphilus flavus TaxID=2697053 RepID=A0A6L9EC78_9FLAO|nr:outer membrane beta-barrel protein [Poritiphilus flavus]NAS12148.1 outer membrane beta-barrel protein [Poritiphilus flavus]
MKSLISVFLFFFITTMAHGQMAHGFEIGANLMNADFTIDDEVIDTKNAVGPRAGYVGEFHLTQNLYLRGALLFMQKGFKFADETWALSSFDIPINFGSSFDLARDRLQWFLDGGISTEYNARAITKIDGETVELEIGNGEGELKSLSTGLNLGTGLQFARLLKFRVSYYTGLTNLINTEGADKWKNRYLAFSLNFLFRK